MRLKFDKPTLDACIRVCEYGIDSRFENIIIEMGKQVALESLKAKLLRADSHIVNSRTVMLSPFELLTFTMIYSQWKAESPTGRETILILEGVIRPITEQVSKQAAKKVTDFLNG